MDPKNAEAQSNASVARPVTVCKRATVARSHHQELGMKTRMGKTIVASAAAAAAILLASAGWAANTPAAAHEHDAATPHALALNHGKKWPTDAPLRQGMDRIRTLVSAQIGAAHAGKLGDAQFQALAGKVEAEVGNIVANCKLEPEADAMLHLVIAEIGAGTDTMAGKDAQRRRAQGLVQVVQAVNDYGRFFAHPGFRAINTGH